MIFEKVKAIIVENLNCEEEIVTLDASLSEDLGADSLAAVELSMALEEAFDITIGDEDIPKLKTVNDIVNYVEQYK